MTDKQKKLIECMNEFCREKCDLDASKKEASEYIDKHMDEYKLATMDEWAFKYS